MNREIKFRFYKPSTKKMIYSSNYIIGSFNDLIEDEDWKIMQFTGLLDKENKEIYEGDIVSYTKQIQNYDDDDIMNPRYYKTPQYEDIHCKSVVKYKKNSFIIDDDTMWEDLNVIGNIYENIDLL